MAVTTTASGTQTATIGTEHTLAGTGTLLGGKTYTLTVDTGAMTWGDILELRVKTTVLSGGTERQVLMASFAHPQDSPIKQSIPVPFTQPGTITLKQTAGTGRAFPWTVTTPD